MTGQPTSLAPAQDLLATASAALAEWHAKHTDIAAGRTYVAAGHECIAAIDQALRVLHDARVQLVDELRRDDDDRAVRVDLLLAQLRAERDVAGGRHTEQFAPGEMPPRGTVRSNLDEGGLR